MNEPERAASQRRQLAKAASSIATLTTPVFQQLTLMAAVTDAMQLSNAAATGSLSRPDTDILEQAAIEAITATELITGAGMAVTSQDHPGCGVMNWWILRGSTVVSKRHVVNPHSDSYYDFSHSRWFQVPAERRCPTLIAPYVDSWGTDDLTITAAIPRPNHDPRLTTIIAADLDARAYVQSVENLLTPASPAALVDAEDRAVTSTVPEIETGARLSAAETWSLGHRIILPHLDWSVVLLKK